MSEQKLTPLMKFKKTIKKEAKKFTNNEFHDFLVREADILIEKEKEVIANAYNQGVSDNIENNSEKNGTMNGYDYYDFLYDLDSFNSKFIGEEVLNEILLSSISKKEILKKIKTRNNKDLNEQTIEDLDEKNIENLNEQTIEDLKKQKIEDFVKGLLLGFGVDAETIKSIKL